MNARILVVDDSRLARRMLRQILESVGHMVEEAPDGAAALDSTFSTAPTWCFWTW